MSKFFETLWKILSEPGGGETSLKDLDKGLEEDLKGTTVGDAIDKIGDWAEQGTVRPNAPSTSNQIWNQIENKPIEDGTLNNIETQISGVGQSDLFKFIEEQQKKQWEREDLIRQETQAREDTAYQRAVADMVKAGINPNLMNVQPSASGGGITSATGLDYTLIDNKMAEALTLLEQEIDQAFKEDENSKDRFIDIFGNVLQMLAIKLITKGAG